MFELAYLFTNNCVLQRDKTVRVFGSAPTGSTVNISINGINSYATARENSFTVYLPAQPAGGPYTLKASCGGKEIILENVVFGDVWLAGGQSNMEFQLKNADEKENILEEYRSGVSAEVFKRLRFYDVPHVTDLSAKSIEAHKASIWQLCSEENLPEWTAVATFFAKTLAAETGVTIGIVDCNWGGTSASNWVDGKTLAANRELGVYFDDYKKKYNGDYDAYLKALEDYKIYSAEWEKKKDECYKNNPEIDWNEVQEICGPCQWPGPIGPLSEFRPCGLYKTMLQPCAPYTLKGFIYYQGESDDEHREVYHILMRELISVWRREFQDTALPFILTQLPMFKNKTDPDYTGWGVLREAQDYVVKTVKNAYMAVILDLGKFSDIHPTRKQPVGERLAKVALAEVYKTLQAEEAYGPFLADLTPSGSKILLSFKNASKGFIIDARATNYTPTADEFVQSPVQAVGCSSKYIHGFEVAGTDGKYVKAKAVATYENGAFGFELSADEVAEPVHARYAYINWDVVTVFGANGLPLAPFIQ